MVCPREPICLFHRFPLLVQSGDARQCDRLDLGARLEDASASRSDGRHNDDGYGVLVREALYNLRSDDPSGCIRQEVLTI